MTFCFLFKRFELGGSAELQYYTVEIFARNLLEFVGIFRNYKLPR